MRAKKDAALAGCLVVILSTPFLICLRGWVFSILWLWFICPFGIRPIGIAWAMGLATICSMLQTNAEQNTKDTESDRPAWVTPLATAVLQSVMCLLFGWIYHSFMPH
jgi:hypothetical protein